MKDLAFARLTHRVHVDPDDSCPLCIADEVEEGARARLDALRQRDPFGEPDGGRLLGQLLENAHRRRDLADAIREGDVELTAAVRSRAFGLSVTWKEGSR